MAMANKVVVHPGGKTFTTIQDAIDNNTGGMGGLSTLTPEEIAAIADALQ